MPANFMAPTGLDVISTRHIGAKERLLLVKVGERYLLLGATQQAINTLAEFTAAELPEALQQLKQPSPQTWAPKSIKQWLSKQPRSNPK